MSITTNREKRVMAVKKVEVREMREENVMRVHGRGRCRYHSEGMTWYDVGGEFN
jgi:hypothetical protein